MVKTIDKSVFKDWVVKECKIKWDWLWIENPIWYDGIACYQDKEWNRYSRNGNPIDKDELCKFGKIYKVKQIVHSDERFDYDYEIISVRPDE